MNRTPASLLLSLSCFFSTSAFAQHEWSYDGEHGPRHWAALNKEYASCGVGKAQSPVDIRGAVTSKLAPIQFDYRATPLHIIDNGHTVQVNYGAGSSITVDGKRYELVQFHFHRPSEETIDGTAFPMEAHLVHKDAEGHLAVVAVLLRQGIENPFLRSLWANLPAQKEKEMVVDKVTLNAAGLLPKSRAYYTFPGSLTTPPCSEGVTWFVLTAPVDLSAAQVARFDKIYSNNARPTQPLNGRVVRVSQ
jgi:carbonic anhydrase